MASGTADLQRDLGGAIMQSIFGALLTAGYAAAAGAQISASGANVSQEIQGDLTKSFSSAADIAKQYPSHSEAIIKGAQEAFLKGDKWAYTAGIIAVLIGSVIVALRFPTRSARKSCSPNTRARNRSRPWLRSAMPEAAVQLALASSIYPPAIAAVIALGRGEEVRLRVILLVMGAYLTVFATGLIMLALFNGHTTSENSSREPSAWAYIVVGVALLWVANRVRNKPPGEKKDKQGDGGSKIDKYLEGRWLVLILGVILYVIPSPIYAGAVRSIADTHSSTATKVGNLAIILLIMLWLIELPMLILIAVPEKGQKWLEGINNWFGRNTKKISWIAALAVAIYMIGIGVVELL